MATNITIELRQQDSKNITANGEYEIILGNEIQIEEGDIIQLREAFIDTVDESNIIIPEDITLQIKTGLIYRDWFAGDKNYISFYPPVPVPLPASIEYNCQRFTPYIKTVDTTNYETVSGYFYNLAYNGNNQPAFKLIYEYENPAGEILIIETTFDALTEPVFDLYLDVFNPPIIAKVGSVVLLNASIILPPSLTQVGVKAVPYTLNIYKPYEFTTDILVPAGSYNPTELSIYISQELNSLNSYNFQQNNNSRPLSDYYNNNFIWTGNEFDPGNPYPGQPFNTGVVPPEGTYFIPNSAPFDTLETPVAFVWNTGALNLIGASQIALEFNTQNNKFEFTFAHMPMYDSTNGTNIVVRYFQQFEGFSYYTAPDGGGIYFTGLTAVRNRDLTPFDFWEGILGFDLDTMLVKRGDILMNTFITDARVEMNTPFVDGINTVTAYSGIDNLIVKGANTWYQKAVIPSGQGGLSSTVSNTISIRAKTDITQLLTKFSHYIVATDLNFANNNYIASESNFRTFNGIVSKYYSYDSYTFGDSVSAIQYQHAGATQALKSIKVRILKSDKKPDTNLLADNTIILELIKAPPTPPSKS
jgi:hypothetical protein